MSASLSSRPVLPTGDCRVTALGTGRPFSRLAQANSGWLIELGNGDVFVFDFGFGSFQRFAALELPLSSITGLVATHMHTDHVGDFAAYWLAARIGGRLEPLDYFGPSGDIPEHGFAHFAHHQMLSYQWDTASRLGLLPSIGATNRVHQFDWTSREPFYDSNGVVIRSFPAIHIHDGAVGLVLEWNGFKIVYSGDTAPSRILVSEASDADLVIHESANTTNQMIQRSGYSSSLAKKVGGASHTQPDELGGIFDLVSPRLAIAFHFNNDIQTSQEISDKIRRRYHGPLLLAQDLVTAHISTSAVEFAQTVVSDHTWPNISRHEDFWTADRGVADPLAPWLEQERITFNTEREMKEPR